MSKIKKSALKQDLENLLAQMQSFKDKLKIAEERISNLEKNTISSPVSLPLMPFLNSNSSHCSQCSQDLSKSTVCGSVNCPYSVKVTF